MCMNKKLILPLIIMIMISAPLEAFAHEGNSGKKDRARLELKIENKVEDENEEGIENEAENKLEVNDQRFEIRGEISSISGNTFVVLGQTITVDSTRVNEFEQKGILQVGKTVAVEGIIENNTKFAREIKVLGIGQGRFRVEINNQATLLTPFLSVTPSATVTPSVFSNSRVEIKAKGSADVVAKFLDQILSFLKSLI